MEVHTSKDAIIIVARGGGGGNCPRVVIRKSRGIFRDDFHRAGIQLPRCIINKLF